MAATTSVSGLVSGLDTSSLISQMMQIEAQTQTRIKSRMSAEQSNVKSLQDLNSKLAALATSAGDLSKATAWNPVSIAVTSAGSTFTGVAVSGGTNAVPGPLSFTVGHTARAHALSFTDTAAMTDVVTTGSTTVTLDLLDGTTQSIDTGDGTLAGLVRGLNANGTGVKASTVRLDDGTFRLQVVSTTTGQASDFAITNTDGSAILGGASVTAGRDAEITIGSDTVHSSTNTFSDIANGLSITLKSGVADNTTVNLDVTRDATAMTAKVKALVDAVNDALTKIDGLTDYNATTKTSGPLAGDAAVQALRNRLLDSAYPGNGTSLAGVGIQLDRYGKLVFDADKFTQAYTADPSGTAARFTDSSTGLVAKVATVAKGASNTVDGAITVSINGRNTSIRRMQDDIDDWDNRLALRQEALTRQYAALETALSQMNSQSSWLSGQLGQLSSGS